MNGGKAALTIKQYQSLLNHCAATQSIYKAKALHCHIITGGLLSDHLRSSLSVTYAMCGRIPYARKLFDELPQSSLLSYNIVIRMYVHDRLYQDAINVFVGMIGRCCPDSYTYPFVVKAAAELNSIKLGSVLHGRILRGWFGSDRYVQNSLLAMYMNCGRVELARKVFDGMKNRDAISWNTIISGYYRNGFLNDALMTFDRMVYGGIEPDRATVVSVLPVCGHLKDLEIGREVHKLAEEKGLVDKLEVKNALVNMYMKCNRMDEARFVFNRMENRDVISWTSMINGYIEDGDLKNALDLCRLMQFEGVKPNAVTIASLVSACGSACELKDGQCLHGWAIRQMVDSEIIIETALISMYSKCKRIDLCFKVLSGASEKQTGTWSAIIAACVQNRLMREALELFKRMRREDVEPNIATLNGVLPAFAVVADMRQAMDIHCYLTKSGFMSSIEASTCLIDVYSKCGSLESAHKIFDAIPRKYKCKDVVLWSALISGYAIHSDGPNALMVFREMLRSDVKPNEVTFTSVLHACSHTGLVDEGLTIFEFMLEHHRTAVRSNHFTCVVDLLGRAGRLKEAYDLISAVPFETGPADWGALLGACEIHENAEFGEVAANKLFELEPENTGNYMLLMKIYGSMGRWKDVENVRNTMTSIGLSKKPGLSLVQASGSTSR